MTIENLTDRICLQEILLKRLLLEHDRPELQRVPAIEYALSLLAYRYHTDDIALSIIYVERSHHTPVASLANNIAQAFLFMSQNKRGLGATKDFCKKDRDKARAIWECYAATKQARTMNALYGTITGIGYGAHDPVAIGSKIIQVFGGEWRDWGDSSNSFFSIVKLPWGSIDLVKIGDGMKCSESVITFGTQMNMESVFDSLRLLDVNPARQQETKSGQQIICFSLTVEYTNDLFDRLYFRIVSLP
ncbi:MAG: hypothetical protein WC227_03660 [Patescibacteria group bacterium]|jgi:hypothetical protein